MFRANTGHLQKALISGLNELPEKLRERLEGSWAGAFYEMIFTRIDEKPYAVLYADSPSRPNVPVNVLVGLEMLKAGNGWSDEEMYESYCYNVQVRRALGLYSLEEGYVSMRTIYVFRERLSGHMRERGENLFERTFEQVTREQVERFRLKTGRQRIDSTQIASNIREMSRLQLLVEVLQRVYRMLSEEDKKRRAAEFAAYVKGTSGQYTYHLKGEGAHRGHLKAIGELMARLVKDLAEDYEEHETWRLLKRVFGEHFEVSGEEGGKPKEGREVKADSLQSPDDPEASYRSKRGEGYVGYVANITETSDGENAFQLILKVQVEPNTRDDAKMLAEIVPELKKKYGLNLMDADGGYGSPEVDEVLTEHKVQLRQTALRGRNPDKEKFNLADCHLELDAETGKLLRVTTPKGGAMRVEAGRKPGRYILRPPQPAKTSADPPAPLYISRQQLAVALRRQRSAQPEPNGKNPRAAVEATIGAIKRPFSNDTLPVRGKFRMGMMIIGAAAMVNLRRIQRFRVAKQPETVKTAKESGPASSLLSLWMHTLTTFWLPSLPFSNFSPP